MISVFILYWFAVVFMLRDSYLFHSEYHVFKKNVYKKYVKRKKGQDTCFGIKRALAAQSLSEGLGPTPHCDNHSAGIKPREDDPLVDVWFCQGP